MADKVQPLLERMVPDLEEQQDAGIYSAEEIKAIVKKRRDFEYLLVRRSPDKADYLRYIAYELNLDALRLKRKVRLGIKQTMKSDHAAPRQVHLIFDRALRRFKSDASLWMQWVDFSLRSGSTKALTKIFPKALQLLPRCVELWTQAAAWSFDTQGNVSEARMFLQRGLRVNAASTELWTAYFKLECLFVLRVRARRMALGLGEEGDTSGAGAHRAAFMAGAVPQVVFDRAIEAVPSDVAFRQGLLAVLRDLGTSLAQERASGGEAAKGLLFPRLHRHILTSMVADFPTLPAVWRALAESVLPAVPDQAAAGEAGTVDMQEQAASITAGADSELEGPSGVDTAAKLPSAKRAASDPGAVVAAWAGKAQAHGTPAPGVVAGLAIMQRACAVAPSRGMFQAHADLLHSLLAAGVTVPGGVGALQAVCAAAAAVGAASGETQTLWVATLQVQGQHDAALEAAALVTDAVSGCGDCPGAWTVYAGLLGDRPVGHPTPLAALLKGADACPQGATLAHQALHRGCLLASQGLVTPASELHASVGAFSDVSTPSAGQASSASVTGVPPTCPPELVLVCQLYLHCVRAVPRSDRAELQGRFATWVHTKAGVPTLLALVPVVVQGGASVEVFQHLIATVMAAAQRGEATRRTATTALFTAATREHGHHHWGIWAQYVGWLREGLHLSEASRVYEAAVRKLDDPAPFVEAVASE